MDGVGQNLVEDVHRQNTDATDKQQVYVNNHVGVGRDEKVVDSTNSTEVESGGILVRNGLRR